MHEVNCSEDTDKAMKGLRIYVERVIIFKKQHLMLQFEKPVNWQTKDDVEGMTETYNYSDKRSKQIQGEQSLVSR